MAETLPYHLASIVYHHKAKGDFIMFGGIELMFKWSYNLHGMHKFSFFK